MTPAEFEWEQEKLELAYERGDIGKISFARRMMALGFSIESCREYFKEIDARTALSSRQRC